MEIDFLHSRPTRTRPIDRRGCERKICIKPGSLRYGPGWVLPFYIYEEAICRVVRSSAVCRLDSVLRQCSHHLPEKRTVPYPRKTCQNFSRTVPSAVIVGFADRYVSSPVYLSRSCPPKAASSSPAIRLHLPRKSGGKGGTSVP